MEQKLNDTHKNEKKRFFCEIESAGTGRDNENWILIKTMYTQRA